MGIRAPGRDQGGGSTRSGPDDMRRRRTRALAAQEAGIARLEEGGRAQPSTRTPERFAKATETNCVSVSSLAAPRWLRWRTLTLSKPVLKRDLIVQHPSSHQTFE